MSMSAKLEKSWGFQKTKSPRNSVELALKRTSSFYSHFHRTTFLPSEFIALTKLSAEVVFFMKTFLVFYFSKILNFLYIVAI